MRKIFILTLVVLTILGTAGCKKMKAEIPDKKQSSIKTGTASDDITLAKAIIWPQAYKFTVSNDPFKPLEIKEAVEESKSNEEKKKTFNANLLGIVVLDGNPLALIEFSNKTMTYKDGDKIEEWEIDKIFSDRVVVKKGEETAVLKIGGENE